MTKHRRDSDDPALDPRVRAVLDAAAVPAETAGPLPGEDEALAAFRASRQCTKRPSMLSRLVSAKTVVASAIGTGVLLAGGVGAAAAGVLPNPAQDTVSTWLEPVGISVPRGDRADENANPGGSGQAPGEDAQNNADPRGSGQTPGERGNENGDVRGRSEQAPGERGNGNGDQCGRSEQPPGERGNGNGDQTRRSEETPGRGGQALSPHRRRRPRRTPSSRTQTVAVNACQQMH